MADSSKEASLVRQAGANGTEIRTQPNKLLTEYLRYRGNDLATMQFTVLCCQITICIYEGITIIRKIMPTIKKRHPIFVNSPLKRMQSRKLKAYYLPLA